MMGLQESNAPEVLSNRMPEPTVSTQKIESFPDVPAEISSPSVDLKETSKHQSFVQTPSHPKPTHTVVISSLPLGAMVFIDGKAAGRTLLHNIALKEGRHHLELHFGEAHIERTVDVTGDTRFVWRPNVANGTEEWSSFSP